MTILTLNTPLPYICFYLMRVFLYIFLSLLKINIGIFIARARHICGPIKYRSSRMDMFGKKDVLKKFAELTGKHLCQSLFLIKLQTSVFNTSIGCFSKYL